VDDAIDEAELPTPPGRSTPDPGPGWAAPLVVGVGGATGSVVRYEVSRMSAAAWGTAFPWGTLAVNVAGCALIGLYLALVGGRLPDRPLPRLLVVTGFLGGLTTFSAFAWETVALVRDDRPSVAALYVVVSVVAGLAAVLAGSRLAGLGRRGQQVG
jgi:fluoride exporter